jgi:hypothetical protein
MTHAVRPAPILSTRSRAARTPITTRRAMAGALCRQRPGLILLAAVYLLAAAVTVRTPATAALGLVIVTYVAGQLFVAARRVRRDAEG